MVATIVIWSCACLGVVAVTNPEGPFEARIQQGSLGDDRRPGVVYASRRLLPIWEGRRRTSGKLDQKLEQQGNEGSSGDLQSVIVTVKGGAKAGVRKRLQAQGQKVAKDHGIINALTVRVDRHGLDALIGDPDVSHVSTDADMTALGGGTTEPIVSSLQKNLALGNWFAGSSLTIAVIDSGIAATRTSAAASSARSTSPTGRAACRGRRSTSTGTARTSPAWPDRAARSRTAFTRGLLLA